MGMNVIVHKKNPTDLTSGHSSVVQELLAQGIYQGRNLAAANTTYASASNSVTWTPGFGVTEVTISAPTTASLTGILVVFDAPNDAVAAAWLADAGSATTDIQYVLVEPGFPRTFQFISQITRLDVLPLGANCRVVVEAV